MTHEATFPLLFVLSPALQPDPSAALERRLRRSLLRRGPVEVGSASAPYEPGISGSPLRLLLGAEGLEVAVTTATPRILRDLSLLAELDRRHSVTVRMALPVPGPVADRLRAVQKLAAEGIAACLLLTPVSEVRERDLRRLLEDAREAGVYDVSAAAGTLRRSGRAAFLSLIERLRLEHGFPRAAAGRG